MEKRKKAPKETICLRMNPQTIEVLAKDAERRGFSISKTAENHILNAMNHDSQFTELVGFMNNDTCVDVSGMQALEVLVAFDDYNAGLYDDDGNLIEDDNTNTNTTSEVNDNNDKQDYPF